MPIKDPYDQRVRNALSSAQRGLQSVTMLTSTTSVSWPVSAIEHTSLLTLSDFPTNLPRKYLIT